MASGFQRRRAPLAQSESVFRLQLKFEMRINRQSRDG